ncbi:hypothetical protein BV25DRAFT_1922252 [Artomyces pyxidatus]|uniref:Uncharacterized protein n=1 Tax=Artomyces pyxidatus TaxID=48021 RepID=A0ACB8SGT9_9AGAM|nr:hypothetical protein BV25DRAFT_1922252 [Artomyces pyxidatus]
MVRVSIDVSDDEVESLNHTLASVSLTFQPKIRPSAPAEGAPRPPPRPPADGIPRSPPRPPADGAPHSPPRPPAEGARSSLPRPSHSTASPPSDPPTQAHSREVPMLALQGASPSARLNVHKPTSTPRKEAAKPAPPLSANREGWAVYRGLRPGVYLTQAEKDTAIEGVKGPWWSWFDRVGDAESSFTSVGRTGGLSTVILNFPDDDDDDAPYMIPSAETYFPLPSVSGAIPPRRSPKKGTDHSQPAIWVVFRGRMPGIFTTWEEAYEQVHRVSEASTFWFWDLQRAREAYQDVARRDRIRELEPGTSNLDDSGLMLRRRE